MTAAPRFDELIHAPNRLRICAALAAVTEAEFSVLRESLEVTDPVLQQAPARPPRGRLRHARQADRSWGRVRTWVALTSTGRRAFEAHVAELHRLTEVAAPAGTAPVR